jgi:curved DNA-binding protein CbpA
MAKRLYSILGIDEKASPEEIRKAFKNKAKKAHPDKGGSNEEMSELNKALSILINPSKRASYDKTGNENTTSNEDRYRELFQSLIQQIFPKVRDFKTFDLVSAMVNVIVDTIKLKENEIKNIKEELIKINLVSSKLSTKGNNTLITILQSQINLFESMITSLDSEIKFLTDFTFVIKEYTYAFEEKPVRGHSATTSILGSYSFPNNL